MIFAITFFAIWIFGVAIIAAVHDAGDRGATEAQSIALLIWPFTLVPFLLYIIIYYPLTFLLEYIKDRKEESK